MVVTSQFKPRLNVVRIVYRAKLNKPIILDDYWGAPFMQGKFHPIEEKGKIIAFEVIFSAQPIDYAPKLEQCSQGEVSSKITTRDQLIPFVRYQLESAFAFVRCYFDADIAVDEIEASYSPETLAEEDQIPIKSLLSSKASASVS